MAVQRIYCSMARMEMGRQMQPVAEEDPGQVDSSLNLGENSGVGGEPAGLRCSLGEEFGWSS